MSQRRRSCTTRPRAFHLAETLGLLKWGLVGLVAAVAMLGAVVGVFARRHGATVYVDADDAGDLTRLLTRIKEVGAACRAAHHHCAARQAAPTLLSCP